MSEEQKKRGRPKGRKGKYTVSSTALAQRRANGAYPAIETDEEKDFNARSIDHLLKIQEIAQMANRDDLVSLQSCFVSYLQLCQEDGFRVSNLGAYAAMGMSHGAFEGFKRRNDPAVKEFCAKVQMICSVARESLITENKINPVIGIFWQRNYDGLRNDTEQAQAIAEQEEDYSRDKSYKDKYKNIVDE